MVVRFGIPRGTPTRPAHPTPPNFRAAGRGSLARAMKLKASPKKTEQASFMDHARRGDLTAGRHANSRGPTSDANAVCPTFIPDSMTRRPSLRHDTERINVFIFIQEGLGTFCAKFAGSGLLFRHSGSGMRFILHPHNHRGI